MKVIKRQKYLDKIRLFINKPVIKVITGMRRSGKSFFLQQIIDELKTNGVKENQIIFVNKDSLEFDHIKDYKDLDNLVKTFKAKKKYLFIDEVQEIDEWQKAIVSFFSKGDTDIFITGSNAHMLSSELATRLSGRYIEFPIYTLSFKEFLDDFRQNPNKKDIEEEFMNYIKFGGFPAIHNFELDEQSIYPYIASIFDTVVLKDVVAKNEIRNIKLLENIIDFVLENIGSPFSAKSVADYLKSQKLSVGVETIQNYLAYLEAAYIVKKAPRYDLKGKRLLEINEKYYLNDLGIRHARLGFREDDISDYLENIVFFELKRRGYEVTVGKLSNLEIDFIAKKRVRNFIYKSVTHYLVTRKKEKALKKEKLSPSLNYYKKKILILNC
jgi:predicted AAA+ superfamily ATPase